MAQRTSFRVNLGSILCTVGTWALAIAANILTLNKTAADDTSVLAIPINVPAEHPHAREHTVKSVDIEYSVATADLDAAPTVVADRVTMSEATGVRTRAAEAQAIAFVGTNAVGLAVGTYVLTVTFTTPVRLNDNEELWIELTINAAATSVVKLGIVRVNLK